MGVAIFDRAQASARYIREHTSNPIDIAVVLGSGLGEFAETLVDPAIIPYEQIPDFARSTVEGHSGRLVIGQLPAMPGSGQRKNTVAVMQGRFHYYEGYALEEVTLPIRTFGALGVKRLILTNAAGGVNPLFKLGALMLITDHINLMMISPLRGQHDNRLGDRFPDMTEVYSREYQQLARETADEMELALDSGVYLALQGPNYETPAEIRMMRVLGADAVGMSTVPEAIVARQMGMQILGISLITNQAAGLTNGPIDHESVMKMGSQISRQFGEFLGRLVPKMVKETTEHTE
ncbi:MAG: purine-nucleoside phosphorylase [Acidobacteria bacterium]|nr:purine-nucleoside phosphorylase [Acidobacteriota bacterium]MCW5970165.1 purine-nucleoside phosphorylase [Blastocatellales bacterium]